MCGWLPSFLRSNWCARGTSSGCRVQSHISGECSEVASSLVEHWLFGPSVIAGPASTAAVSRDTVSTERRVRGASGPSTLLGPEGTAAMKLMGPYVGQDRFLRRHVRRVSGTAR